MDANERAYMALLQEGVKHGKPAHYQFDLLEFDRATLGLWSIPEAPPYHALPEGRAFGWILRHWGTEFLHLCDDDHEWRASSYQVLDYHTDPMNISRDYPPLYYFWDGEYLTQCESGLALKNMATEHNIATMLRTIL